MADEEARIFLPEASAMQRGYGKTRRWHLEFRPCRRWVEPLMGWTSVSGTRDQVHLTFASRAEAEAYARSQGLRYGVEAPAAVDLRLRSYAENFRYGRKHPWTH